MAPFMADECLLSMQDIEGIDYTMKEYMKYVEKTRQCVERLNASSEGNIHNGRVHFGLFITLTQFLAENSNMKC